MEANRHRQLYKRVQSCQIRAVKNRTNMDGFNMEDGSGLSRLNAVNSAQMTVFYLMPTGSLSARLLSGESLVCVRRFRNAQRI